MKSKITYPERIFDRLVQVPHSFTDKELRRLTNLGDGRVLKGTNARIPPLAFLELNKRHAKKTT